MNRFLAVLNIFFTIILIFLGAYVKNESLGVNCNSWPICYSETSDINNLYPMIHRFFAGLVLVINGVLFYRVPKTDEGFGYIKKGILFLIIQSTVGALSAVFNFPTIINSFHLLISILYIVTFSRFLNLKLKTFELPDFSLGSTKDTIRVLIFLIFIQIIFGSVLNHTTPRTVCGTGLNLFSCLEFGSLVSWPMRVASKLHMSHRYFGMFIGLFGIFFIAKNYKVYLYAYNSRARAFFYQFLILTFSLVFHFIGARYLFMFIDRALPVVIHLALAVTILISLFGMLDYILLCERKSGKYIAPTLLADLFELTKPRLGLLVVSTTLTGVLISAEFVDFFNLFAGMSLAILIVAAATTLNCYIEKDVDAMMERTKDRALPSGRLDPKFALIQGWALISFAVPMTAYFVNWETALLGLIAFLTYLYAYTPMKRTSPFALYVGAIPGAIPPVMGRTIVVGDFDLLALCLFVILFIWQVPHFLAISIYHKDDYAKGGIKVYSHYYSQKKMTVLMFVTTVALMASALSPYYLGLAKVEYLICAFVLSLGFVILALLGFFTDNSKTHVTWARKYFWGSIIYLPLLMLALIFFN